MVIGGSTTLRGFEYMLRTHGVSEKLRLVGHTPSDEEVGPRGAQISAWLKEHTVTIPYVVIDDLDLGISEAAHPFVQTDGKVGLTEDDVEAVVRLLTG